MNNAKKELLVKPKALKRRQQDSNQRSGSCSPTPYHLAMSPQITICLQIGCSGWKLAKQVVRQNTAFRSLQTKHYCQAPRVGLEPTTLRLTAECSTIELSRNNKSTNFYDYSGIRKELQSLFTETSDSLLLLSVPSKPHTKSFIQTPSVPLNRYQG